MDNIKLKKQFIAFLNQELKKVEIKFRNMRDEVIREDLDGVYSPSSNTILVNKKIHGGWHYVNKNTGSLFKLKNLEESIHFMMSSNFSARDYFMSNYGFKKSSCSCILANPISLLQVEQNFFIFFLSSKFI